MNPTSTQLASLELLFSLATDSASQAMERWTRGQVTLSLDRVCELPLEEAIPKLGITDDPVALVLLRIEGELTGDMVLLFDEQDGRELCRTLTGREGDPAEPWGELEQSALMETGNIVASAYLNGLTKALGSRLLPSPPFFMIEFGASVVEQVLLPHGMTSDKVFVSSTTFRRREGGQLNANVFVIPTDELREAMQQAAAIE